MFYLRKRDSSSWLHRGHEQSHLNPPLRYPDSNMSTDAEKIYGAMENSSSNEDGPRVGDNKAVLVNEEGLTDLETVSTGSVKPLETAEDIVTHVIQVDDDPSMNPWTARMFIVGKSMLTHVYCQTKVN